ncbi:MAG: AMP-binding protein [Bacillota bacterium]
MVKKLLDVEELDIISSDYNKSDSLPNFEEVSSKDIAIIGMSGKFPMAEDIDGFWNNIINRKDCIRPISEARRKDIDDYLNFRDGLSSERKYENGAFLDEIDKFDYNFFRLSPKEAQLMNPNQRLFLETAWEAIEDAGYGGKKLLGSKTGVYVGYMSDLEGYKYRQIILDVDKSLGPISVTGNLSSILASRISYLLDLNGPSMLVDTACSASLVSVHLACQSLRNKECDMALVGAVRTILLPSGEYDKVGIESSDSRTKTFDESSDGTGVGEGTGVIVLKPLSKALKDGDNIYAVIKGSSTNQDGSSIGISAPNVLAQEDVILKAWKDAGINPETIGYIEAHGTGTKLGDPIEIHAISKAFRRYTDKRQFCAIGSLKTNIGHLYEASGVIGIIKCIMALNRKTLPPAIHFRNPNRKIDFMESPVYVNVKPREWKSNGIPLRCGISSFGFSGTNCHVILEEAPPVRKEPGIEDEKPQIFKLSAKSEGALRRLIAAYSKFIARDTITSLRDICYTANTGRGCYNYRIAMIIKDRKDFEAKLQKLSFCSDLNHCDIDNVYYGKHSIVPLDKEIRKEGEITEEERRELTKVSELKLDSIEGKECSEEILAVLCRLYIEGSDIAWERLYANEKRYKARLPKYTFERERCWVDIPKVEEALEKADDSRQKAEKLRQYKKAVEVRLGGREVDNDYTEMERLVGDIWNEVLGFKEINIYDSFYELGGDSISMMKVISRIEEKTGKNVKLNQFIENNSIIKLALLLCDDSLGNQKIDYPMLVPDFKNMSEPFSLTEVQMAYLIGRDDQFEMGGVSTHVYVEIETGVEPERLNRSLNKLINRHPMLRSVILPHGEQQILESVPEYKIAVRDLRHLDKNAQDACILKERERMSHDVFKTDEWPLYEFKMFRLSDDVNYLFIGIDSLIADRASLQIIVNELMDFYNDEELELPEFEFTFRDYMITYEKFKTSEAYHRAKDYWMKKLDDFPTAPLLPLKKDPSSIKNPRFSRLSKSFDKTVWEKLKRKAQKNNITPSALLCTAYAQVLSLWSNQSRLAINLTVFNRYPFYPRVEEIIGDFTSIILLGIELKENSSFWDSAKSVQSVLMEALENRHFDGVKFIREIANKNGLQNKAIMPIVFTSALFGNGKDDLNGLGTMKMGVSQTSQVFIDNQVMESNGDLSITWDYAEDLFESEVISTMFEQFTGILAGLMETDQEYRLSLSQKDIELIESYNRTEEDIEASTLHGMFMAQARRTPDKEAVVFEDDSITYRELDEKSNQIARYLMEQGVGANDLVGVVAQRCVDTIVNVMGILKSGAAYVPIDPMYPEERRKYIVSNSNCKLILDPEFYIRKGISGYPADSGVFTCEPESLAYVIYTSGSTGKPKGVVIKHKAAANTIIDINGKFNVNEADRIIGLSSMCFDLSVYDIFGALSTGAVLVMVRDQRDMRNIYETVENQKITIWNSVPAIMDMLVENISNNLYEESGSLWSGSEEQGGTDSEASNIDFNNTIKYYWSPIMQWYREGNRIYIGKQSYTGFVVDIFPKIYFLAQKGVTLNGLVSEFDNINPSQLKEFIEGLIANKVLVCSLLSPYEVFSTQNSLFKNEYGEEMYFVQEEYDKFKYKQLSRTFEPCSDYRVALEDGHDYPDSIKERRSHRSFDEGAKIPFNVFSQLLAVFKQNREYNDIRYYYASAGGLYPIDVFVYIKENRIENLKQGLYYYHPVSNSLNLVNDEEFITEDAHYFVNKEIYKSSAFSIFLIYNAEANMPKYGSNGYFYSILDAGIMTATLNHVAETLNIGLCSIGDMDFKRIEKHFKLNENQVFIHLIEGGIKSESASKIVRDIDGAKSLMLEGIEESKNQVAAAQEHELEPVQTGIAASSVSSIRNSSLRLVLLSGDWIPLNLPDKVKRNFPDSKVISLGGATEASIWSIYYPVEEIKDHWRSIPYGIPLANQKYYVLNYKKDPCPAGVQGELYIGGIGLAEGYINDKEKTDEAFIKHPELGNLYKTGDYGILHKDGYIEFLGRKDSQVKIRGYRIELGEIEKNLMGHANVKNAVVIDRTDANRKKYLCAYVVLEGQVAVQELREYLSKTLPNYMIPAQFVSLDRIPLTQNGKVDRKSLPEPQEDVVMGTQYKDAQSDTEERLVEIWRKLLEIQKVGVEDNFFSLGGDSLKATTLATYIRKEFEVEIPLRELFKNQTIRELASYIERSEKVGNKLDDENMVLLKKGKDKTKNLFIVHAGSGEAESYMGFTNYLDDSFNYWGVKADRFKDHGPQNLTDEQIAKKYLKKMLRIQEEGPYHIAGWCVGGTIAFEIVRQLEMMNEEVGFLGMFNSSSTQMEIIQTPVNFSIETEKQLVEEVLPIQELKGLVENSYSKEQIWSLILEYAENDDPNQEVLTRLKEAVPVGLRSIIPYYENIDVRNLIYYINVIRSLANARSWYVPAGKIKTQIHFFKASLETVLDESIWNQYCEKPVKTYTFLGDHFTMFKEPNVLNNSETFDKIFIKESGSFKS